MLGVISTSWALLNRDLPASWAGGSLDLAVFHFHLRVVELAGNAGLSILAGVLYEISEWHTRTSARRATYSKAPYHALLVTFGELTDLLRAGDGDAAEAHWRKHLHDSINLMPPQLAKTKVLDIID